MVSGSMSSSWLVSAQSSGADLVSGSATQSGCEGWQGLMECFAVPARTCTTEVSRGLFTMYFRSIARRRRTRRDSSEWTCTMAGSGTTRKAMMKISTMSNRERITSAESGGRNPWLRSRRGSNAVRNLLWLELS